MTILGAIGEVGRFPSADQLVGYAGLGARVHDSGQTHQSGRITKTGRKDIRYVMVEAARHASRWHPHWRAERARLELRLGTQKAIVAIARKLLVAAWHVLSHEQADRFAEPTQVACALFAHAYRVRFLRRRAQSAWRAERAPVRAPHAGSPRHRPGSDPAALGQ